MTQEELTPADRANRLEVAAGNYTEFDAKTGIIDLLADIRHWCDLYGETFAELDRIGYGHYLVERDAGLI